MEPNPNLKWKLLMESALSAASGSGQQQLQMPATELETEATTGEHQWRSTTGKRGALPSVMGSNTRRRNAEKNSAAEAQTSSHVVAITRAHDLGLTISRGGPIRLVRHSRSSLLSYDTRADGWNLTDLSHLTVARHWCEKIHLSLLIATLREGEERRICSAASKSW